MTGLQQMKPGFIILNLRWKGSPRNSIMLTPAEEKIHTFSISWKGNHSVLEL